MFWEGRQAPSSFLIQYTLRQFTRLSDAGAEPQAAGLVEMLATQQTRLTVFSDAEAKAKLSSLLLAGRLPSSQFYRLVPSEGSELDRGSAGSLDLSFYLFDDGRLCPVRIWSATERFGTRAGGPAWTVDFNGIPPWSRVLALQPYWERCSSEPSAGFGRVSRFAGSSARNWAQRDCWRVCATA